MKISLLLATTTLVALTSTNAFALVYIDIDLGSQQMHVNSDSGETYDWAISSGRKSLPTPKGNFHSQAMYVMIHSAKYNNAPMPHSIFFHGGYAIHGTEEIRHLGHPVSHGCVRLHPNNATILFNLVKEEGGAEIKIH